MLLRTIFPQTHITFGNKLILNSQLNSYALAIFFSKFSKLETFTQSHIALDTIFIQIYTNVPPGVPLVSKNPESTTRKL